MITSENGRLLVYAWCHLCIDALCCFLLYRTAADVWLWIIGYHMLAFAFQPVFGWILDRHPNIASGKISILLILCAYAVQSVPILAIGLAGIGNALFHIEGGYVSLHRTQRKIGPGGFFVGTGALGIGMATIFGVYFSSFMRWPILLCGVFAFVLLMLTPVQPELRTNRGSFHLSLHADAFYWLFAAILVRGYGGMNVAMPIAGWTGILVGAILSCVGKMAGGYIADQFGAKKTVLFAQIAAAFCVLLSYWMPFLRLAAIVLINLPMAVTLAALSDYFPEQTGLAFGLAPLALYIGYVANFLPQASAFFRLSFSAVLLLGASYCLHKVFAN